MAPCASVRECPDERSSDVLSISIRLVTHDVDWHKVRVVWSSP